MAQAQGASAEHDSAEVPALFVLIAQLAPNPRRMLENAARVRAAIAAHPSVDIVVFPELFLTGYETKALHELRLTVEHPVIEQLRRSCRDHSTALVVGFIEDAGEQTYNSLLAIDSAGEVAGVYRKTHLFGAESEAFDTGADRDPIVVDGVSIGFLICFDIEFPEPARQLALAGADLLVSIAANMEPYYGDHLLASRSRSLDNRLPHVYVNMVGANESLSFVGGSRVVAPDGGVLAEAAAGEHFLIASVPIRAEVAAEVDYLGYLRREHPPAR